MPSVHLTSHLGNAIQTRAIHSSVELVNTTNSIWRDYIQRNTQRLYEILVGPETLTWLSTLKKDHPEWYAFLYSTNSIYTHLEISCSTSTHTYLRFSPAVPWCADRSATITTVQLGKEGVELHTQVAQAQTDHGILQKQLRTLLTSFPTLNKLLAHSPWLEAYVPDEALSKMRTPAAKKQKKERPEPELAEDINRLLIKARMQT